MSETAPALRPKKSVALAGVTAGSTALCTVGQTGNDLHYRGYDIQDLAREASFEEVAYLLIHGELPNAATLAAYQAKLKSLRGLSRTVRGALEVLPPAAHPMDVLRTGVSAMGCALTRSLPRMARAARATLPISWSHRWARCSPTGITSAARAGASRWRRTMIRSAATSCICCTSARHRHPGCGPCTSRSFCTPSTSSMPRPSRRG